MTDTITDHIRSFNRFYTNILGLIDKNILESEFSLTEARILFEIHELIQCTAITLTSRLSVDKGYMSRIIRKFEKKKLIEKSPSLEDSRASLISLTSEGLNLTEELIKKSNLQIENILKSLTLEECEEVSKSMDTIKKHLTKATKTLKIRNFTNDDLDFVINNQIKLYEVEYGFDTDEWKSYIKDGVGALVKEFNKEKDCIYILENQGQALGCIAITHVDDEIAQLRFFFIDSSLRGMGGGNQLVKKAIDFCKEKNYKKVYLWTFSTLKPARHLYAKNGFKMTDTHENTEWGTPVLEERWDLDL